MFLSSLSNELIIKCIEILFFKITVIKEKKFDYMQVENILMNINNTLEHSSLTRRILKEHQDSTMDAVAKSLNNLNSLEQKINDSINYIKYCKTFGLRHKRAYKKDL
jgi:dsDNA-specific endonuclease/ATPase MutS2